MQLIELTAKEKFLLQIHHDYIRDDVNEADIYMDCYRANKDKLDTNIYRYQSCVYIDKNNCGTVGCLMGHASCIPYKDFIPINSDFRKKNKTNGLNYSKYTIRIYPSLFNFKRKEFNNTWEYMFGPRLGCLSKKELLERMQEVIDYKEND